MSIHREHQYPRWVLLRWDFQVKLVENCKTSAMFNVEHHKHEIKKGAYQRCSSKTLQSSGMWHKISDSSEWSESSHVEPTCTSMDEFSVNSSQNGDFNLANRSPLSELLLDVSQSHKIWKIVRCGGWVKSLSSSQLSLLVPAWRPSATITTHEASEHVPFWQAAGHEDQAQQEHFPRHERTQTGHYLQLHCDAWKLVLGCASPTAHARIAVCPLQAWGASPEDLTLSCEPLELSQSRPPDVQQRTFCSLCKPQNVTVQMYTV